MVHLGGKTHPDATTVSTDPTTTEANSEQYFCHMYHAPMYTYSWQCCCQEFRERLLDKLEKELSGDVLEILRQEGKNVRRHVIDVCKSAHFSLTLHGRLEIVKRDISV